MHSVLLHVSLSRRRGSKALWPGNNVGDGSDGGSLPGEQRTETGHDGENEDADAETRQAVEKW